MKQKSGGLPVGSVRISCRQKNELLVVGFNQSPMSSIETRSRSDPVEDVVVVGVGGSLLPRLVSVMIESSKGKVAMTLDSTVEVPLWLDQLHLSEDTAGDRGMVPVRLARLVADSVKAD